MTQTRHTTDIITFFCCWSLAIEPVAHTDKQADRRSLTPTEYLQTLDD